MAYRMAAAVMAAWLCAGVARADDYKPVRCAAAKPYAGAVQTAPDITAAFGAPASPDVALDTAASQRLDVAMAKAMGATHAAAMTAAVMVPGHGRWQASRTADGAATDKLFFWASAGKTLTAIAVLQLVEEGRLSLGDPVATWIKGVPNGDVITVGQLLDHTSGLFSANEDLVVRKSPHRLGLEEEVKILNRHGAMFCPDDSLGDVAPPVSQSTEPAIDPRQPGAAGAVVASAADMAALWQGLLDGQLVSPETVRGQFAALYPMFGQPQFYGQGVMVYVVPSETPDTWVGHSGGAPGVKAVVAYSLNTGAFVAVAMTGDGSAEATAALLLRQLP